MLSLSLLLSSVEAAGFLAFQVSSFSSEPVRPRFLLCYAGNVSGGRRGERLGAYESISMNGTPSTNEDS